MADTLITVAVASCGRESLTQTLASLDAMTIPDGVSVELLVADDDPDGGAAKRIAEGPVTRLPLRCIPVGARNISEARNTCLREARGDLLAFVDDDEWVAPDWLERMLACKREHGATCVFGPVYPQYPEETPGWIRSADPLHVDWGRRGKIVTTGRSGNTLFDIAFVIGHALRFNPEFGVTGGEDTAFFAAVHEAGGKLVVTDDAAIYEHVPVHRIEMGHIRTRALRSGQSWARTVLGDDAGIARRTVFAADAFLKMLVAYALAGLAWPVSRATSLRMAMKAWMNRGKLREVAGQPFVPPYRQPLAPRA